MLLSRQRAKISIKSFQKIFFLYFTPDIWKPERLKSNQFKYRKCWYKKKLSTTLCYLSYHNQKGSKLFFSPREIPSKHLEQMMELN